MLAPGVLNAAAPGTVTVNASGPERTFRAQPLTLTHAVVTIQLAAEWEELFFAIGARELRGSLTSLPLDLTGMQPSTLNPARTTTAPFSLPLAGMVPSGSEGSVNAPATGSFPIGPLTANGGVAPTIALDQSVAFKSSANPTYSYEATGQGITFAVNGYDLAGKWQFSAVPVACTASGAGAVTIGPPDGTSGPSGSTGPAETGPTGATGEEGATQPVGSTATTGPTGDTAPSGPSGATGETGASGATGASGPTRATGATGPTGPPGSTTSSETTTTTTNLSPSTSSTSLPTTTTTTTTNLPTTTTTTTTTTNLPTTTTTTATTNLPTTTTTTATTASSATTTTTSASVTTTTTTSTATTSPPGEEVGPQVTWRAPDTLPLSDAQAAARVMHRPEQRPENAAANEFVPSESALAAFRQAKNQYGQTNLEYNPLFAEVTGRPGLTAPSTDDLIQWAAAKWGIPVEWLRAQYVVESYWRQAQLGDLSAVPTEWFSLYPPQARSGSEVYQSMGIAQVKWMPGGEVGAGTEPLRWESTAFNIDYQAATVRYYFDGLCTWCTSGYSAGQQWNSIGAWFEPYPWENSGQANYIKEVQVELAARPWASPSF
jgi:hypothetical protein